MTHTLPTESLGSADTNSSSAPPDHFPSLPLWVFVSQVFLPRGKSSGGWAASLGFVSDLSEISTRCMTIFELFLIEQRKIRSFSHIMVPYLQRRKTTCNYRRNITLFVVHFLSRLSKKMLLHLSSHFKIASLALIWESTVLRLRANTINQHLRTRVVFYFEVPIGTFGWHFIIPQSSFYRGRITLIHCKTTLLATLHPRQ